MRWFCSLALAWLLALTGPAWAARVVSLNLCTDQLLLRLAPEQAVAVTFLARDPSLSALAARAAGVPAVRADAEAVLRLHPDLVLAGRWGAQATLGLLRARGVRVAVFDDPTDFAGIERQTRQAGALLGEPVRGAAAAASMASAVAALPRGRDRGTAMLLEPRGWSAGPGSLGDTVLRAAGYRDVGTGGEVGIEALATHPPGLLVVATPPAMPSLATDMLLHPALAFIRRATLPPAWLTCGGPEAVAAAKSLRKAGNRVAIENLTPFTTL